MQELQANTAIKVKVGPFVDVGDGFTPETGITLGAADEAELFKHDAAAVTDISGNTWAAIGSCDGWYNLTLTAGNLDTEGLLDIIVQDDSVCLPVHCRFMVSAQAAYISKYTAKDSGYMDVNVKAISEDTTSADDLELFTENAKGTDHKALISTDAQDLSATLDVNTKLIEGGDATDAINAACDTAFTDYDPPTRTEATADKDAIITEVDANETKIDAVIADTEDLQTQIGTDGAGLTNIPWNSNWDTEVQSEVDDALKALELDHLCKTATAGADMTTEVADNTILSRVLASGDTSAFDPTTDSLQDIRDKQTDIEADTQDLQTQVGTDGAGLTNLPWNSAWDAEVESEVDDALGAGTGTALTAIPWNASWDAEVQSECADALTAYDPPTKAEMDTGHGLLATEAKQDIIDTVVDGIQTDLSNATDGLGALKTEIDANETKIDTVDTVVDGIQTDLSNATDGLGALKALIDTVDGVVDAILVDTDSTIPNLIITVDGVVDAIKVKTDGLPSGIEKGAELDITFPMILSSDHETYATGKTLTEEVSKDKGNYAACTNNASEIQTSGTYGITITATEMDANVVTLRFTETDCDATTITIITS